jgi:hypothetical protein
LPNKPHQRALFAPPKIERLSSPRSQEIAKRKEDRSSSGRVIEESTQKRNQREWKRETDKARKEGVSKMVISRRRTRKRYGLKIPVLVTEILNCVARLEH